MTYELTGRQRRKGARWIARQANRKRRQAVKLAKATRKHCALWQSRGYPNGCPDSHRYPTDGQVTLAGRHAMCDICPPVWKAPNL